MSETVEMELCEMAASFFQRGLAFGSTGNMSVRTGDCVWITPTGRSLANLKPQDLACVDTAGRSLNGNKPSKEFPFHLGCYKEASERCQAVVHLHATHSVALSCLENLDPAAPLPVFTPYYLMRVAPLAVVSYFRPGSEELAHAICEAARGHNTMLLRHHGLVSLGASLNEAADRAEELEETARLYFLLRDEKVRLLSPAERDEIQTAFGKK